MIHLIILQLQINQIYSKSLGINNRYRTSQKNPNH